MNDDQIFLPPFYIAQIAEELEARNIDSTSWLANQGVTSQLLTEQSLSIKLATFKQLVISAKMLCDGKDLGLSVGKRLSLTTHGMLGFALMASHNLREAISLIGRYLNIRTPLLNIELTERESSFQIQLSESYFLGEIKVTVIEAAIGALYNVLKYIAPTLTVISKIQFPYQPPDYQDRYQQYFAADIEFAGPCAIISIENSCLDVPLEMGNEQALNNARSLCEAELKALTAKQSLEQRVRTLIFKHNGTLLSRIEVANLLHLSARTMHRRLQQEGTSYAQILKSIRFINATNLLADPSLSIKQISVRLGYSETASFRKALKLWTGLSPREYRAKHLSD